MKLPADFRDLLCEFNSAKVEYLLVGAYAMAVHGHPRFTGDIDLYYKATRMNAERILSALRSFGIASTDISEELLLQPNAVLFFGHPPVRIDLLNAIDGVEFDAAWQHRDCKKLGDMDIPVISLRDLLKNKQASGRAKDFADVELIRKLINEPETS